MQNDWSTMLPYPIKSLIDLSDPPEEIRLYKGKRAILKRGDKKTLTPLLCDQALFEETLSNLTNRSFYSHSDGIKQGYIALPGGARAGVSGQAVAENGRILAVKNVDFLCIRIPRPVPGAAEELLKRLAEKSFKSGALIYSPPGVGKTTVLRELARALSSPPYLLFTALIDERGELSYDLGACPTLTVYRFYPKATALRIALRTSSPEYLILDEIGSEEIDALRECGKGGVPICASVHASSISELRQNPKTVELLDGGLFDTAAGLTRSGTRLSFTFTPLSEGGSK